MKDLPQEQRELLRFLTGAPMTVLLLICYAGGEPVGTNDLVRNSLLSKTGVTDALRRLEGRGLIQHFRRYDGWTLPDNLPVQLGFLFSFLPDGRQTKFASLGSSSSSSLINPLNDTELTTTTTAGKQTKFASLLPSDALPLADLLVQQGANPDKTETAILSALERWPVGELASVIDDWRTRCDDDPSIDFPGAVIAYWLNRRMAADEAPRARNGNGHSHDAGGVPKDLEARKRYYVPPGYEDLINP